MVEEMTLVMAVGEEEVETDGIRNVLLLNDVVPTETFSRNEIHESRAVEEVMEDHESDRLMRSTNVEVHDTTMIDLRDDITMMTMDQDSNVRFHSETEEIVQASRLRKRGSTHHLRPDVVVIVQLFYEDSQV